MIDVLVNELNFTSLIVSDTIKIANLRYVVLERSQSLAITNRDEFFNLAFWTACTRRLIDDIIDAMNRYQVFAQLNRKARDPSFYRQFMALELRLLEEGLAKYYSKTADYKLKEDKNLSNDFWFMFM